MANIQRPVKRGDVRTFHESYSKGFKNIWASEVDADLDVLYDAWNFGTFNVGDGTVGSDQLIDGAVGTNKLADGSVTNPKIADDAIDRYKIQDEAVVGDKIIAGAIETRHLTVGCVESLHILDGTIQQGDLSVNVQYQLLPTWGPAEANKVLAVKFDGSATEWIAAPPSAPGGPASGDLEGNYPGPTVKAGAITNAKLGPGAAVASRVAGRPVQNLTFSSPTETVVLTFPSITTRGGSVRIVGSWGIYTTGAATGSMVAFMRVKRDGTLIHSVYYQIGTNFTHVIPVPACIDVAPAAGAHVYTITCQVTGNGIIYSRPTDADNGQLWIEEI